MSEETKPVAFRLTVEQLATLDEAAERKGLKRSDFVRELVLRELSGEQGHGDLAALVRELQSVRDELLINILRVNKNVRYATAAVLCDAGKVQKTEAEKWVREVLD